MLTKAIKKYNCPLKKNIKLIDYYGGEMKKTAITFVILALGVFLFQGLNTPLLPH